MPWLRVGKRMINMDNIAHFIVEQEDVVQISMIGDADKAPIRLMGEEARALKKFIEGGELGEIKRVFITPGEGAGLDGSRARKKRAARGVRSARSAPHVAP